MNTKSVFYSSPHILAALPKDTPVLLAFSGGADSSTLFHLLLNDAKENGFKLHAAHFHHGIRGEEADRDARFCEAVATKNGIPFYLGRADVPALAKANGNSIEAEAREQRYSFFEKIMREHNIPILVTAHHSEDQIESILLHMLRGSGIGGLCGMQACRELGDGLYLVRPLLYAKKDDVLAYCNEGSIDFVTDSTNSDTSYTRNALRHEILPRLRAIQPNLDSVFDRLSKSATDADDYIRAAAKEFIKTEYNNGIPLEKFNQLHSVIKASVLSMLFSSLSGTQLSRVHIESIVQLAERAVPHSSISLPAELCAQIEDERLLFLPLVKKQEDEGFYIPLCEGIFTACEGIKINVEKNPPKDAEKGSAYLDIECDLLNESAHFSPRQEGDTVLSGKMNKKIKKLYNERKIPLNLRKKLPLLVCDNKVLWIPTICACDEIIRAKIKDGSSFYRITVYFESNNC